MGHFNGLIKLLSRRLIDGRLARTEWNSRSCGFCSGNDMNFSRPTGIGFSGRGSISGSMSWDMSDFSFSWI